MLSRPDESLRTPLLLVSVLFGLFIAFFASFQTEDQRGSFDVEGAISRMCQVQKSYSKGWLGNISAREAVIQVWNARLYQEMKVKLVNRKGDLEVLDKIFVDNDSNIMIVNVEQLVRSEGGARTVLRDYHSEIMGVYRNPASIPEDKRCFLKLTYELFNEIRVTADEVEVSQNLP